MMQNEITIPQTNDKPTGCLILLHGSGDTGHGLKGTVLQLLKKKAGLPHIKIVFPTAPVLPFTPFGGMEVNTWYDISGFSKDAEENSEHIDLSAQLITEVINKEVSFGIPINRIAIAGFSRGGAMSYYMGYSYMKELACVGVMSSWIPNSSSLRKSLQHDSGKLPPLFQTHGSNDQVVHIGLAKKTLEFLKSVGIVIQFNSYSNIEHEVIAEMLINLYSFVESVIPDI